MVFVPFLLAVLFFFVLGTVIGSFLNVVIIRTIEGESWVAGRSRCDHCRKTIAWFDNVPLLSFVLLKGKCRYCKKSIALSHPVVEGLTALLFVWWYIGLFFFFKLTQEPFMVLQPLFWLAVAVLLLVIFFTDMLVLLIPDKLVMILSALVVVYRLALIYSGIMVPKDFVLALVGMGVLVLFFFCLWFFTGGRGLGFGDVKLIAPLALLMGWPDMIVGVFAAFIIGAVVGLGLVVSKKHALKQPLPFGPFLIVGTVVALVWGNELIAWYLQLFA